MNKITLQLVASAAVLAAFSIPASAQQRPGATGLSNALGQVPNPSTAHSVLDTVSGGTPGTTGPSGFGPTVGTTASGNGNLMSGGVGGPGGSHRGGH